MNRLRTYPWVVACVFMSVLLHDVLSSRQHLMPSGQPVGSDYITYWSASEMAHAGRLADSYQLNAIAAVQQLAAPVDSVWEWFYPPTFALLLSPLTTHDYLASFFVFSIATLAIYAIAIRYIQPPARFLPALLLAPSVFINLYNGQNASLTAGLAGLGLAGLNRFPIVGGIILGVISVKPQLAVPLFLLLLMHREWHALIGMLISAALLVCASLLAYGLDSWIAWANGVKLANTLNAQGELPWHKMSSVFSSLRALGMSADIALTAQLLLAVVALMVVRYRFIAPTMPGIRHAAWLAASLTLSPHLFNYDMLWLIVAMAFMTTGIDRLPENATHKILPGLLLIWTYPMIAPVVQSHLGFNLEFMTPWLMLWLLHDMDRANRSARTHDAMHHRHTEAMS